MAYQLFRTPVNIPQEKTIKLPGKWFFIGSCFAEEIGARMKNTGIRTLINPAGILFNPLSISNILDRTLKGHQYNQSDLDSYGEYYLSWQHHGSFKSRDAEDLLDKMKTSVSLGAEFLKNQNILVITWGSAIVYRLKTTGEIVGNCHKLPNDRFSRKMLQVDDITSVYEPMINQLINENPGIRIVMTVSPVRYQKDGFMENQISKSILFVALNKLIERFPGHISYFPAYEIMMDELRDYRFYKEDMIHPNSQAVSLIWQYFKETYFNSGDQQVIDELEKYSKMKNHRPLHPESESSSDLESKIKSTKINLLEKYDFLDSKEL